MIYVIRSLIALAMCTTMSLIATPAQAIFTLETSRSIAEINRVNCNPYALPANPDSCEALGITREDFEVTIRHREWGIPFGPKRNHVFRIGDDWERQSWGNFGFRVVMKHRGDKVCFFTETIGIPAIILLDENYKEESMTTYLGLDKGNAVHFMIQHEMRSHRTRNCILTPRPKKPTFDASSPNSFIPPVCRYGCDEDPATGLPACHTAAGFKNSDDALFHKPALSVIVQCVSEFSDSLIRGGPGITESVAMGVLRVMKPFALALLALFFVLEGYKYASGIGHNSQNRLKPKEFNAILIKTIFVVVYFSSDISTFFYDVTTSLQRQMPIITSGSSDGDISFSRYDALSNYEFTASVYDKSVGGTTAATVDDFSYKNCAFDDSIIAYTPDTEYLRLWDILDCKVSQYLGYSYQRITLSDLTSNEDTRDIIREYEAVKVGGGKVGGGIYTAVINAFTMMWQSMLVITFLALVYCAMVFLIFAKYVTVYVSAIIQIVLSFIILPIILPAILFPFAKEIFYETMRIILKAILFPAVYTVFFLFILTFMDKFFYEGNNVFNNSGASACAEQGVEFSTGATVYDRNQIALDADCKCLDRNSLACLLAAHFNPGERREDIVITQIKYMYNDFRDGVDQADFIIQYGKLMLIFLVMFAVLTFCNDVAGTLTSNQFVKTFSESMFSSRDVVANPIISGTIKATSAVVGRSGGSVAGAASGMISRGSNAATGATAGMIKRKAPYIRNLMTSRKTKGKEE